MRVRTKYPGVSLVDSDPSGYAIGSDGSVSVPHGRPECGQPLEESNYYEITEGRTMNDIMQSVGLPAGEVIMGPGSRKDKVKEEAPKKRARKSTKKVDAEEPKVEPKAPVLWDIPGIGDIKSEYTGVYVGDNCVCLQVDPEDTAFIPRDYRDNNSAVYIMRYKGFAYKVIYSGLNFKMGKCTAYVLLGGYYDGQEE